MPSEQHHPDDEKLLRQLGYEQEMSRRMSGFSNFAISLSTIWILAGGITSFHVGLCSAGGASIGLGWPLVCIFSLCVAATMAQVARAFPTAGGLYQWGSILGGRACGWLILAVATVLTIALLLATKRFEWARLWTFTNFSGLPEGGAVVLLLAVWFGLENRRFKGPPQVATIAEEI